MTEAEWVEKVVIPNCFDPDDPTNPPIPPGTPWALGSWRRSKEKSLVKIGKWEQKDPRNIWDLFEKGNPYDWKIEHGLLVVHVSFYMPSDDEPATPKSGRSGKRKRRVSVQSEEELVQSERGEESVLGDDLAEGDDAAQSEGGDDLAVEDDAAQLEGGDDSAVEDDAAQSEGGDDSAVEDDASQSGDHTTPSHHRRRLPMPHKLSTVHPDNVDPLPEFNTGPVVKSEPGEGNARRSHPAVQRRSKRFK
ncbi:hypothetical protein E4U44_006906 [Claviceps purpurea]|nr:hypothetical protein E4U44_006906 [Claviceps purpurea]